MTTSAPTAPATRRPTPPVRATTTAAPHPAAGSLRFGEIRAEPGHRILLYGPGGIGKTTLATSAPGPVAVFDLDDSLPVLADGGGLEGLDVRPVLAGDWAAIRAAVQSPGWDAIKTLVIDSATKAEELALAWTLANVKTENGRAVERIEEYGYGKGYRHLYDTFMQLLGDLDRHVRAGRNVILVCHDCTQTVPNPMGDDYPRYEPRLQNSGKESNIRARVREWADHVLFVGYDIAVGKDGKAQGCGSRTIYPAELPHCMAKSRTLSEPLPLAKGDVGLWAKLFKK